MKSIDARRVSSYLRRRSRVTRRQLAPRIEQRKGHCDQCWSHERETCERMRELWVAFYISSQVLAGTNEALGQARSDRDYRQGDDGEREEQQQNRGPTTAQAAPKQVITHRPCGDGEDCAKQN